MFFFGLFLMLCVFLVVAGLSDGAPVGCSMPVCIGLLYLFYKFEPVIFWGTIIAVVVVVLYAIFNKQNSSKPEGIQICPLSDPAEAFTPFVLRVPEVIPVSAMCDQPYTVKNRQGNLIYYIEPDADRVQHIYGAEGEVGRFEYSPDKKMCTFYSKSGQMLWIVNDRGEVVDANWNDLGCFDERLK